MKLFGDKASKVPDEEEAIREQNREVGFERFLRREREGVVNSI